MSNGIAWSDLFVSVLKRLLEDFLKRGLNCSWDPDDAAEHLELKELSAGATT